MCCALKLALDKPIEVLRARCDQQRKDEASAVRRRTSELLCNCFCKRNEAMERSTMDVCEAEAIEEKGTICIANTSHRVRADPSILLWLLAAS